MINKVSDLNPLHHDIELTAKAGNSLELTFIEKDCTTQIETSRDLSAAVVELTLYDLKSNVLLSLTGVVSGLDNNIVTFTFTSEDLTVYPTVYGYNLTIDTNELYATGYFIINENKNFKTSYPS